MYKRILITLIISLFSSFVAFAQEGITTIGGSDDSAILCYIDNTGVRVKNEWKQAWDNWYYFGEDGKSKQNTWAEIDGKWYYFDNFSRMLHDTTTPDGHTVGSDGAWIKDGQVVVETVAQN